MIHLPTTKEFPEPVISISGVELSVAQAMTIRVALQNFLMGLEHFDSLGTDPHGRAIRDGYLRQGQSINALMARNQ